MTGQNLRISRMVDAMVRSAIHQANVLFAIHDMKGKLVYTNPQFRVRLNVHADAQYVRGALGNHVWQVWKVEAQRAFNQGKTVNYAVEMARSTDGTYITNRDPMFERVNRRQKCGLFYSQVIPLGLPRELVANMTFVMQDVADYMPSDDLTFNPETTIAREKLRWH